MQSRRKDSRVTAESITGFANPLCVLGLSADAQGSDIQQAAHRALMERRLGEQGATTETEIRLIERANERLKDPVTQFHAALHWVTLNSDEVCVWGTTAEVRSLAFDHTMLVESKYEEIATADSVAIRNHNIAVLLCADAHRLASLGDVEAASSAWTRGFERWSLCLASDEFKRRQMKRAHLLDDARLNSKFVRQEVEGVPRRLLAEPAALASRALEQRQVEDAVALVEMIRTAPFERGLVDGVLEMVYRPLARRVETEIDGLNVRREEIAATTDDSTASNDISASLRSLLRSFTEHIAPDLEQMLVLGDLPGLAEENARDHASRFLEKLGLNAWNLAEDASLAQEATGMADRYADAQSLKSKLAKSLSQLSDQQVLGNELDEIMEFAASSRAPEAIERLQALREKVSSKESHILLNNLIDRIRNHHAVTLFKEALALADRRGDPSVIRRKLEEAHRFARDPESRAALDLYLSQIRTVESRVAQQGTGCLIPIVVGLSALGAVMARGLLG